jgi:hypothetical protein
MKTTRRLFCCAGGSALLCASGEPDVPPLDAGNVRISGFREGELELARTLPHFARVANAVRMQAPDRGFIDVSVWRNPKDNQPYNARIMENILSLAWYYSSARRWNPYRGNPALRSRLEAALEFWCGIQDPQGRLSEYGVKKWNLAATAFSVKFVGEALRLLKNGPPLDRNIYERSLDACRKAIEVVLTDVDFWKHGLTFSNQYTNVFAGAPAYFEVRPDPGLYKKLVRRIEESSTAFQSPCGYFYEADGPDFGYNLGTHHTNVHMAWHYFRKRPEAEIFVRQQELFCDWLAYNAWPEADELWAINRSIECRQRHPTTGPVDTPITERSLRARAFARSREKVAADRKELRAKLERDWPNMPPLAIGQFWAFSPYQFLHLDQFDFSPKQGDVNEAERALPARSSTPYVHERMDTRHAAVFHYIRTPAYIAAFASGKLIRPQQRLGLTFVWTPRDRTIFQSQTSGAETSWGDGDQQVYERARYRIGRQEHKPAPDVRNIPGSGAFEVEYPLPGGGVKRVRFEDRQIVVESDGTGAFTENIPLMQAGENEMLCEVESSSGVAIERAWRSEPIVGEKRVRVVTLRGSGPYRYRLAPRA